MESGTYDDIHIAVDLTVITLRLHIVAEVKVSVLKVQD